MTTKEKPSLLVCINQRTDPSKPCCAKRKGRELADALENGLKERGIDMPMERVNCLGQCRRGANARIAPGGRFFFEMKREEIPKILDELELELMGATKKG